MSEKGLYSKYYEKEVNLPDGRSVWIQRKMFTYAILIGPTNGLVYDQHWCYETKVAAEKALDEWDPFTQPEPQGWIRHPVSGRRRPHGDASKEYIAL